MKPIFEPKSDDKLFCSLFWNEETYVKVGLWCTKLLLFDLMKAFFSTSVDPYSLTFPDSEENMTGKKKWAVKLSFYGRVF